MASSTFINSKFNLHYTFSFVLKFINENILSTIKFEHLWLSNLERSILYFGFIINVHIFCHFFDNTWCEDDKCYFLTCVFLITEDVFALIFPNDLNKTHILLLRSVDFIFFFGFYDFLRLGLLLIWKESAVKMATYFLLVVCFFLIDTSYVPIVSFDVTLNFRYRLVNYSCRHQFYVCQN